MSVKTRLKTLIARLADALTAKGVEASAEETLTALVGKVGEIEDNIDYKNIYDVASVNGTNLAYYWYQSRSRIASTDPLPLPPDTSKVKSFKYTFAYSLPQHIPNSIDTSSAETTECMFYNVNADSGHISKPDLTRDLTGLVLNMQNVTKAGSMFDRYTVMTYPTLKNHENLIDVNNMFAINSQRYHTENTILENCNKIENFDRLFYYDYYLTTAAINVDSATSMRYTFDDCRALANLTLHGTLKVNIDLKKSPLTVDSAKGVINALANYAGTENEYAYTVAFSDSTKTLLGEEGETSPNGDTWLLYAQSKGWNI